MPLEKKNLPINFSQSLDTKTDPFQIQPGKFLELENSVFTKGNLWMKRFGYDQLSSLPDDSNKYLTTFNGNLTAIGTSINAFSQGSETWTEKGSIKPISLETLPLIRNSTNQSQCDSVVASNGYVCTVYTDNIPSGGSNVASYRYVIADSVTGQNIIAPTVIPVASGTVTGSPRVFILGRFFVIVFTNIITATPHLQYVAITITNPTQVTTNTDISAQYDPDVQVAFDGVVYNNSLYLAWNGSDVGGAIRVTYIDSTLAQHTTVAKTGQVATMVSVCMDADPITTTAILFVSYYDSVSMDGFYFTLNPILVSVGSPTQFINNVVISNLTSSARQGSASLFYEVVNNYSFASIASDYIQKAVVVYSGGITSNAVLIRSVGLASKSFIWNNVKYFLAVYSSPTQPSFFLVNESGEIVSKLAYSNGGGYLTLGLPSALVDGDNVSIAYLIKDLVQSVNKTQGVANSAGIYSQTGINLVTFDFSPVQLITSEIGSNLHTTGGFLWMYDGYLPVESGFFVWPDSVKATWSATGGSIHAQPDGATNTNAYFYQVTYEWADNQGNIFRSAPSIPVSVTTTGSGTAGSITLDIPTLRLTYKTANPVKIVVYRWSVAQQIYYQATSVLTPLLNNTAVDSVQFVDTQADASILGNSIIYTNGGVIENISAPSPIALTSFKSRLFLIDAENPNLLWYSKQVIQNTPVEMSDLFTIYVAPTISAKGSTGPLRALGAMDDKLILCKDDAFYYITGIGPDNTGANNDFSDPIFINSTVGCANQNSIVFIPNGLMFESDKGIWILDRNLSTSFIGAPVQAFTQGATVLSANTIPGTNEVRFTMSSGITLLYDYFYDQWGTFTNVPAISSTIYEGQHTYINSFGQVFQQSENKYLDGSRAVLMKFKTGWLNLAGLQGFERAYFFYLLGQYISPHKLFVEIAYDYNSSPTQSFIISPDNFNGFYGDDPIYGSYNYGGNLSLEQWKIYFTQQKCQAFQITITEIYDSSFGVTAGAGLTLSGLDLIVGVKSGYPRIRAALSTS